MSKFVRSNGPGSGRLPGVQAPRLYGDQVAIGETFHLEGNSELKRDIQSSLEIIAQERLLEVETQAKSLLIRAKSEAAKILGQANAQAKEMLEQAQGQVDSIRETAHEEGFKTGYSEGYNDATAQVTQETLELLAGAQTLVDGAYQAEKRVMKHFESRALELIRHIVRRIIDREMTESPATVMWMVEQAMTSLYISGKVQVVVSAQVIHELRGYAAETDKAVDAMNRFEFIADPALDRHQIFIIGQDNCFDLSPETQLEHLLTAVEPHFHLSRDLPPDAMEMEPNDAPRDSQAVDIATMMLGVGVDATAVSNDLTAVETSLAVEPEMVPDLAIESNLADSESNVMEVVEPSETLAVSEPALDTTPDVDPVAWEEFPEALQQFGGFPAGQAELSESVIETDLMAAEPSNEFSAILSEVLSENAEDLAEAEDAETDEVSEGEAETSSPHVPPFDETIQ